VKLLDTDMRKFESSQKYESRAQSADSSKALETYSFYLNTIAGRLCFYLTTSCNLTRLQLFQIKNGKVCQFTQAIYLGFRQWTCTIVNDKTNRLDYTTVVLLMTKRCIFSSGCDLGCIHCQLYFATYCDIWIGNFSAINCK